MTTTLASLIARYETTRDELPPEHPDRAKYDELIANARQILAEFQRANHVEVEHAAD